MQLLALLTQPQGDTSTPPLLRQRAMSTKTASGFNSTYSLYEANPASSHHIATITRHLLRQEADLVAGRVTMPSCAVLLSVPEAVREMEAKKLAARAVLQQEFDTLVQGSHRHQRTRGAGAGKGAEGVAEEEEGALLLLPPEELEAGDGPVLRWLRMLGRTRKGGEGGADLAGRREQLLQRCVCGSTTSTTTTPPLLLHRPAAAFAISTSSTTATASITFVFALMFS